MKFIKVKNILTKLLFLKGINFFSIVSAQLEAHFRRLRFPSFWIVLIHKQNSKHFSEQSKLLMD